MSVTNITLEGDAAMMHLLDELPKRLRDKTLVQAVMAGGGPIKAAMVANSPSSSGLLKKSIKIRRRKYRGGDVAIAVIGPSRGMKTTVSVVEGGKNKGSIRKNTRKGTGLIAAYGAGAAYRDPAKYAHLVEKGRKSVSPKKGKALYNRLGNRVFRRASAVPAKHFASRAVASASGRAIEAMRSKMADGLAAEASSLAGKGG